jgi:hypothetical protein
LSFSYNKRIDRFSNTIDIIPSINIDELEGGLQWVVDQASRLDFTIKTRDFEVTRPDLVSDETSKRTILGGLNYSLNTLGGGLFASTNYQINSGQEPKLEFVFQRVENALGDYVYIGPDSATVQNVNDFRFDPSNPLSQYIRIAIPNNEFIRINNLTLDQSHGLEGSTLVKIDSMKDGRFRRLLSNFSTNSNLRIQNKTLDNSGQSVDPFGFNPLDSKSGGLFFLLSQAIFFNRSDPRYDMALTFSNNGNKSNQINRFEERGLDDIEFRSTWNIIQSSDFIFTSNRGKRTFDSQIFDLRDFEIMYMKLNPEINIRLGTKMRVVTK